MIPTYHFTHNIKQKIIDAHEEHAEAKNKPNSGHHNH
jgi:hypothetical protein